MGPVGGGFKPAGGADLAGQASRSRTLLCAGVSPELPHPAPAHECPGDEVLALVCDLPVNRLVELMVHHGFGAREEGTYAVYRLDEDFFADE